MSQEFAEFVDLLRNIAWARFRESSGSPQQCFEKLLTIVDDSAGAKQGGPLLRSVTVRCCPHAESCLLLASPTFMALTSRLQSTSTSRGVFSRLTDASSFTGTHKSVSTRLQRERERTAAHAKASQASTMMDQADIDAVIGDTSRAPSLGTSAYRGSHGGSTLYAQVGSGSGTERAAVQHGSRQGSTRSPQQSLHAATSISQYHSPSSLSSAGASSLVSPRTPIGRPSRHRRVSMTQSEKNSERRQRLTALVLADYGNDGDKDVEEQQRFLSAAGGGHSPLYAPPSSSALGSTATAAQASPHVRVGSALHSVRAGCAALQVSPVTRGEEHTVQGGFGSPPPSGRRRPAALKGAATVSIAGSSSMNGRLSRVAGPITNGRRAVR